MYNIRLNFGKKLEVLLHVIVWSIFFSFPFLLSGGEPLKLNFIFSVVLLPLVFYALIFYVNYFFLLDRYLFTKRFALFGLLNVFFLIAGVFLIEYVRGIWVPDRPYYYKLSSLSNKSIWNYSRIMISYILTVGAAVSIKMTKRWLAFEDRQNQLEKEHLKSELSGLKYQLQPHFFFNTLNNIYALVDASPEQSKEALHQLSKMMRYLLYETEGELTMLSQELNFTMNYIKLMEMRIPGHVDVSYDFPENYRDVQVLHLLFISLVENAFKHGIHFKEPSFVSIKCDISDDLIRFHVQNSNYPKEERDRSGSGIGLGNLRKRIELLSSSNYSFKTLLEKNIFHAIIEVRI